MSDKLTLEKARELLATKDAEIQGLNARIAETEQAFAAFGITRTETEGKISFTSSNVAELESQVAALHEETETLEAAFTKSQTELGNAQAKVAELQKKDSGVSARAREFLASQGGKPLNISDRGGFDGEMNEAQLNAAISEEKDPRKRKDLFLKLEDLEKKRKSR